FYIGNPPKKKKDEPLTPDSNLTTAEKKRILLNNIFGVDIDTQAVEVTKLNLLLKALEGETQASVSQQLSLFHERVLPNLGSNIKCGNSLIGSDFYDNQLDLFREQMKKINAFDWKEGFSEIFKYGGFDAVIGNPPWVRQELISEHKGYFETYYRTYHSVADLYQYFIEKGISLLNSQGFFSYIVANKWMRANYGGPLRIWLKQHKIKEITDFGDLRVFNSATTYPCIIIAQKGPVKSDYSFDVTQVSTLDFPDLGDYVKENRYMITISSLDESGWNLVSETEQKLLQKINKD
ncbi:MAG: Eco57I restriction-modification methylase domain-containing protein, partial [Bacteroidetes bacterium]|nr:Eco57I restriction-modification methylase domain-containing protein [Bacteroidota bacterium]